MISDATRAAIAASMAAASAAKTEARSAEVQTRAANAQAAVAAKLQGGAPKPAAAGKKTPKPKKSPAAAAPEVAPFYDADALLAIGDRTADLETRRADRGADYAALAAEAARGTQEAELQRVAGSEHAKNAAAARGFQRSSLRDAALDTVDTEAARKTSALRDNLSVTAVQNDEARARDDRAQATFMSAMAARAAQNAGNVVRDPRGAPTATPAGQDYTRPAIMGPSAGKPGGVMQSPARVAQQALAQKRAKNVKGSATLRRGVRR